MTANVPVKLLFEVSNNMVSGEDSAKKGTQLSVIEESCINKNRQSITACRLLLLLLRI